MSKLGTLRSKTPAVLVAVGAVALLAGLMYTPAPVEAQGNTRTFTGCIQSVDQLLTRDRDQDQDRDQLRTHVFLRIQDMDGGGGTMNFGFFRDGIHAGTRRGSQLRAREFADQIEPILRQLREAARDRVRVELTYEAQSQYVNQFRILYDTTCNW